MDGHAVQPMHSHLQSRFLLAIGMFIHEQRCVLALHCDQLLGWDLSGSGVHQTS